MRILQKRNLLFSLILLMISALSIFPFPADDPVYPTNPFSFRIDTNLLDFKESFFTVDLNNDGLLDFTFRTPEKLYAYDHYGTKLWESSIPMPGENSGAKHGAADIDGDGQVEIAAINTSNQIVIFNGRTGSIENTFSLTTTDSTSFIAHIAIANIRGNGDRDAIIQTADVIQHLKGYEFYLNRTVFAVNLQTGQEIWPQRILQDRDVNSPASAPAGIYEGYWGQAHGPFLSADIDLDGKDEVIGANLIDDDGTLISLSYPINWIDTYIVPYPDYKHLDFIDHLDAITVGDIRPDIPGLEWVTAEEDHLGESAEWNTTLISGNGTDDIIWRKETTLFGNDSEREPQNIAIGNYDTTRAFTEVWLRSRLGGSTVSQHPWIFESNGYQFASYETESTLPAGFHPLGNSYGLEMIWTIDWAGSKKEYIAAQARHVHGNIGIFDAVTGNAIWYTGREYNETNTVFLYVADISGDNREEVLICDSTATGLWIRIYQNEAPNNYQPKPDKWQDPVYKRVKQNWNYYSPGSYTTPDYPVISNITFTNVESNGFTVNWVTDILSDSQLEYGMTTDYGSITSLDTALTLTHSAAVTGLSADTQYHLRIKANSQYSIPGISNDFVGNTDFNKKLAFASSPFSVYAGTVSSPVTIQLQNVNGEPRTAVSDITVRLSSSSAGGSFSTDPFNWEGIDDIRITAGSNSAFFYYKDTSVGSPVISMTEQPSRDWIRGTLQPSVLFNGPRHQAHRLFGRVLTASGDTPGSGNLEMTAFMDAQSYQTMSENNTGCGYSDGNWWIECANFPSGWAAGEAITVAFNNPALGENDTLSITLSSTNPQDAGTATMGIDPPWITSLEIIAGNDLRLTWNENASILGYNVYRSTTVPFTPDKAGGSNRIATMITDQDGGVPGVQWTDTSAPIGNTGSNTYYIVTAVNQNQESRDSRIIGEFDYNLMITPGTDLNMIGLPLRSMSPQIIYASDLRNQISGCTSVSKWSSAQQGFLQYVPNIPSSNYTIESPLPYGVTVTANSTFTLLGEYVEPLFNMQTTTGTDFNYITMPLSMTNITNAASLMSTISGANSIAVWNTEHQTFLQYIPELPQSNFSISPGLPYFINVTKPSLWPEPSTPVSAAKIPAPQLSKSSRRPHAVWGNLKNGTIAEGANSLQLTAFLKSSPSKIVSDQSPGCILTEDYWIIQCHSLESVWQPGDTLILNLTSTDGLVNLRQAILLSSLPADKGEDFILSHIGSAPESFELEQNYPNPFNAETVIPYSIPDKAAVTIRIYNVQGRLIRTLINREQEPGIHETSWNGTDSHGTEMSSGLYVVLLQSDKRTDRKKIMLIR